MVSSPAQIRAIHRLFIAYGAVQQRRDLGMYAAAGHVLVLRHRDLGVTELVRADSRGQSFAVDQIGHRFRKLWLVTPGTPNSPRTLRHCLLKSSGSRHVAADDGKIIGCCPQNACERRSPNSVSANWGKGTPTFRTGPMASLASAQQLPGDRQGQGSWLWRN